MLGKGGCRAVADDVTVADRKTPRSVLAKTLPP
jgi:hypothetical protein